ncbi:MAG: photosynthetic complex assembly protein PuhC [Steroidobacteraceae bacterium]|jgi:putative photosynthetic complex assembly protein|nr:photosynthetic complex assembly protein PuhC [Steroidobacteraceae bacterium]
MGDPFRQEIFPKGALYAAAALILGAIGLAAGARLTGYGVTSMPAATAVEVLELRFLPQEDGRLVIEDARRGGTVAVLNQEGEGFVFGVLRGLGQGRAVARASPTEPYRLTRWSDGRMSIADPVTGRTMELDAFGPTNAASFARFFDPARETR